MRVSIRSVVAASALTGAALFMSAPVASAAAEDVTMAAPTVVDGKLQAKVTNNTGGLLTCYVSGTPAGSTREPRDIEEFSFGGNKTVSTGTSPIFLRTYDELLEIPDGTYDVYWHCNTVGGNPNPGEWGTDENDTYSVEPFRNVVVKGAIGYTPPPPPTNSCSGSLCGVSLFG
ncbi:hypothetical protein [Williamsia sp. DF01-3]|uniref:hypothetical protein n=1 Tax=Williamsia sp. DF01-3 TaxID=2934157 RepID=UPI001FF66BE2|nr:hypothetical protein [Williamsia sp. DF01-3]MCK0518353.1 hypothetical protein [Williamsia sp. DF01-3]